MRKLVLLMAALTCSAADWTCAEREQNREKMLSVESVGKLQIVVKRKLGDEPLGAPVIVGRLVTNKGIKDLVFIAGGSDVYAVDPDLSTLFWQRHLDNAKSIVRLALGSDDDNADDDDDISMGIRPLFVLQDSGKIATLNAGSGADLTTPKQAPAKVRDCARKKPYDGAIANGVRFELLSGDGKPVLRAIDAANGRELYRSGNEIDSPVGASGLAIANGHVCFGDLKGTLYCFGFPVDL
jgi:outer membrane protein assembly factor BamB